LVTVLYVGSLLYSRAHRSKMGLRVEPLGSLLLKIGVPTVLVLGTVAAFESYHGIPYSTALFVGLVLLFWFILTKTSFGRHIYAVGGNIEAARRAGINVIGLRITVFVLCSLLAAVGGIIGASRENAVASAVSSTLLLQAIGAAVIGGVSLFGGRGSAWAIVLGVLVIGALQNGLTLNSQPASTIQMVEGSVLLLAVTVDAVVRRAQKRSGR
jgi:D-xylose transport system permease protein